MTPKSLPPKLVLGLAILITSAVILVIVMAIVHCIHKRYRKRRENERKRRDSELGRHLVQRSRATLPTLPNNSINTKVPPVQQSETHSRPMYPPSVDQQPDATLPPYPAPLQGRSRPVTSRLSPMLSPTLGTHVLHAPLRSNTVARHPALPRPGTTLTDPISITPYPITRSARPSVRRSRTLGQISDNSSKQTLSLGKCSHTFLPPPRAH